MARDLLTWWPKGMVATPTEFFGATTSKAWNHVGFVASLPRDT